MPVQGARAAGNRADLVELAWVLRAEMVDRDCPTYCVTAQPQSK